MVTTTTAEARRMFGYLPNASGNVDWAEDGSGDRSPRRSSFRLSRWRASKSWGRCQRQGLNRISVLKNGGFSTELTLLLKHCASREGSTMEGLGGSSKGSL